MNTRGESLPRSISLWSRGDDFPRLGTASSTRTRSSRMHNSTKHNSASGKPWNSSQSEDLHCNLRYGRARAQARAEPSWDLKKYRNLLLDLSISGTSEEKFAGGYIYGSALVLEFLLSEFKNAHYVKFCFTNAILSKSALLKHMRRSRADKSGEAIKKYCRRASIPSSSLTCGQLFGKIQHRRQLSNL